MRFKLAELVEIIGGGTPKTSNPDFWNGDIPWLSVKDFNNDNRYVYKTEKSITEEGLNNSSTKLLDKGDMIISARGTVGEIASIPFKMAFNQSCYGLRPKEKLITSDYLYYLVKHNISKLKQKTHGSVFDTITKETFESIEVDIPNIEIQNKVSGVLNNIDKKIELNNAINQNLLEQVQGLYHDIFDKFNPERKVCKAEEYFDISIGKTPPRKEQEWFSTNPDDITWVSISDMGSCGTFIRRSSEQLTKEAVENFNVKVIPDNTVILSFKLTVGRVAVTYGEMTSNEAIAHFKTDKPYINEYLFCYLKNFNYQNMGSTSSIATAVNSKIIKSMPFIVPTTDEIEKFHSFSKPIFDLILKNQLENDNLSVLRDSLLPKLMSGEIDISSLDF